MSMSMKRWVVAALLTIFVVNSPPHSNAFSVERCHLSSSIKRRPTSPQTICFMVDDAQDKSTSEAISPLETNKKVRKKTTTTASTVPKKSSKGPKGVNKSIDAEEPKVKTKTKKKPAGPMHWIVEMDETTLKYRDPGNDSIPLSVQFKVRGEPRPLVRHRSSRGFMYNPSAPRQESFRNIVKELVYQEAGASLVPLFAEGVPLVMKIILRIKRPNNHFVASRRGPDRMREKAPDQTAPTRSDVDNLGKLVLDALNGLLYHDDRQIISLHLTKLLDNDGLCEGSTEVYIRSVEEDEVDDLILNSFQLDL